MTHLSPWAMVSLWTAVVAGGGLALLLILLYEGWAVGHGFQAWSALALGDGEVTTPSWRKLWWWILLGYAALFGGIVANAIWQ